MCLLPTLATLSFPELAVIFFYLTCVLQCGPAFVLAFASPSAAFQLGLLCIAIIMREKEREGMCVCTCVCVCVCICVCVCAHVFLLACVHACVSVLRKSAAEVLAMMMTIAKLMTLNRTIIVHVSTVAESLILHLTPDAHLCWAQSRSGFHTHLTQMVIKYVAAYI